MNDTETPLEAIYEFPLSTDSTITEFIADVNGKKIVGKLQEKQKAINKYDDALASGHEAMLGEVNGATKKVFKISVGNLGPKETAKISITMATELPTSKEETLLVLPASMFPARSVELVIDATITLSQEIKSVLCRTFSGVKESMFLVYPF
ncbi:Vault protein inter-alpha-trypsin domain [Pelomyxa schiedti]|nr:Vault protein inter-alpha-trypsin domain [Pelomyxa schiedti]